MPSIAINLDWMFGDEADSPADRIRAAAKRGITQVEMWGWRDKDLDEIEGALHQTRVALLTLIVDPQLQLTDSRTHDMFLVAVRESVGVAKRLNAPFLVVVAGDELPGAPRLAQRAAVVTALKAAAKAVAGTGVTLLLENLNSRVDHIGTFLDSIHDTISIVREVDSPNVRVLLDAYHSLVMDEELSDLTGDELDLIMHVQVADAPGRHEPGTGDADWSELLGLLRAHGYRGSFGMEYMPEASTAVSLRPIQAIVASLN